MPRWIESSVLSPQLHLSLGDFQPFYFGDSVHGEKTWKVAPVWKSHTEDFEREALIRNGVWKLEGINLFHLSPGHIKIKSAVVNSFAKEREDGDDGRNSSDSDDSCQYVDDDDDDKDKKNAKWIIKSQGAHTLVENGNYLHSETDFRGWMFIGVLSCSSIPRAWSMRIVQFNIEFSSCPASFHSTCWRGRDKRPRPHKVPQVYSPLITGMEEMCLSSKLSDFTLEINGEEIPAHKVILYRVPYFKALFESGMTETKMNRLQVKDFDAASMKAVLKFIYCAKLPEDWDVNYTNYLPIADHYGLDDLKYACSEALLKNLRRANVVPTLMVADRHHCSKLKQEALRLFHDWKDSMSPQLLEPLKAIPILMIECIARCQEN